VAAELHTSAIIMGHSVTDARHMMFRGHYCIDVIIIFIVGRFGRSTFMKYLSMRFIVVAAITAESELHGCRSEYTDVDFA